jgi:DNA polymerase-3 subunit delta
VLAAYLKDPAPTAVVIFVADELNGNRKLSKILKTGSMWVDFKTLDHAGLIAQARRFAADADAEIGEPELRLLVETVGDNIRRLHNEIEKLATAALPEKQITSGMIESLVGNSRLLDNFALTGNLLSGNKIGAMRTMKKILDDGAEPLAILGLIGSNLRKIMMAKDLMEKGVDTRQIENTIKFKKSDRDAFLAAARRTRISKIHRAINRIAETDLAIKTSLSGGGTHGSRRQIEMLVSELALLN